MTTLFLNTSTNVDIICKIYNSFFLKFFDIIGYRYFQFAFVHFNNNISHFIVIIISLLEYNINNTYSSFAHPRLIEIKEYKYLKIKTCN